MSALIALGWASATTVHAASDIDARGAFSCDFQLSSNVPQPQIPPAIEHDKMYMADRPGMLRKDIPFSFDSASSNLFSGGRYLFKSMTRSRTTSSGYNEVHARWCTVPEAPII